jgi:transposase
MNNSTEIFELALGLTAPWFVEKVEFKTEGKERELHIHIDFKKGHKFEQDDGSSSSAYDTKDRTWQHLDFFQHKCYLHARVPRVKNGDGKVVLQAVPWARKNSGFTLLFEAYAMLLIENEMPVSKAAKTVKVYPQRLWRVFDYWISIAHTEDEISEIENVGFDETSTKKGHNYVTILVDMKDRRVLFATEGKGAETIQQSVAYLESKDVAVEEIKNVCIDMSPAFISGCEKHMPDAAITFDKFHVVKEVNKAMDEVRKNERRTNFELKGHKYTFLKNNLSIEKQTERDLLIDKYKNLADGYTLTQMFKDFWDMNSSQDAMGYLAFWCDLAENSNLAPFMKASKTIKNHWQGIVNYTQSRISNGILEGINSKIQLAKKRARGYRNIQNFINMIYFVAGKLKFNYPHYSI